MSRPVNGEGWALLLPDGLSGGPLRHAHRHLRTMAQYRGAADDGTELEVIVTTFRGDAIGEHGEQLDRNGKRWTVPGARTAMRREQLTQLDDDPSVPPVATTMVVAQARSGRSVCLVVHRPAATPAFSSDAIVRSLTLEHPT